MFRCAADHPEECIVCPRKHCLHVRPRRQTSISALEQRRNHKRACARSKKRNIPSAQTASWETVQQPPISVPPCHRYFFPLMRAATTGPGFCFCALFVLRAHSRLRDSEHGLVRDHSGRGLTGGLFFISGIMTRRKSTDRLP